MEKEKINIIWFRRDLRINDNLALRNILNSDLKFIPIFIFDTDILSKLENKYDRRVDFIHQSIEKINVDLNHHLHVFIDNPLNVFKRLMELYDIDSVYFNMDYEPYAIKRDTQIATVLKLNNIKVKIFHDQVIFGPNKNLKLNGEPYIMFTPYWKQWHQKYSDEINHTEYFPYNHEAITHHIKRKLFSISDFLSIYIPTLKELGFQKTDIKFEIPNLESDDFQDTIRNYELYRNNIHLNMISNMSVHLRFGTISIRQLARIGYRLNETYLKELAWREFFMQILYYFPKLELQSFRPKYDELQIRNNEDEFKLWCEGKTGYPLVDAAMIELNTTGKMHNRLRMVVASFLCKHLLIDWRWGEGYFAQKLNDFELASNNGNWQWCASSGVDCVPYFRMFNPIRQQQEYDPNFLYIKKWIPDFKPNNYIKPIITHSEARERYMLLVNSTYKKL